MRVLTDLTHLPTFRNAVITIGSFDGVHLGHRRILEQVQALAKQHDGESVVITFDPHPRAILNPNDTSFKLLTTTEEKIALMARSGIDNVVVVPFSLAFSQQPALQYVEDFLVKKFAPKYIVIGYDHRFGAGREGDISFLKKFEQTGGFEVLEIPAQEIDEIAISSSKIRKALETSDIQLANRLLGHAFSFSGKVVQGNQIGRTIGFPTANIEVEDPYKLVLPEGIYAAKADTHLAALYVGKRPTLSPDGKRVIEVNILDFEGDLYGQNLTVEVLDFIRPDKSLENLEALKAQIEADKREIERRMDVEGVENVEEVEALRIENTGLMEEHSGITTDAPLNPSTPQHLNISTPQPLNPRHRNPQLQHPAPFGKIPAVGGGQQCWCAHHCGGQWLAG